MEEKYKTAEVGALRTFARIGCEIKARLREELWGL
jgi:hypothetical protein